MDIIFDIDDTLFDSSRRSHLYQGAETDWTAFYAGSLNDPPISSSIAVLKSLYNAGHTIILATGRHEASREVTTRLLRRYNVCYDKLYMRPNNEVKKRNAQVKLDLLAEIRGDGYNPLAVFEDNPSSCSMWAGEGLIVYQVLNDSISKTNQLID